MTQNLGTPMTSFMSKVTPLHYTEVEYKYDLAKAKALLKEAGFEKGFTLTSMVLAGNQDQLNILTTVQQMWAAVGVTLKIEPLDNATLNKRYRAERLHHAHRRLDRRHRRPQRDRLVFRQLPQCARICIRAGRTRRWTRCT